MISFEEGTSGEAVDTGYIKDVENEVGAVFPLSFISFVKNCNGGIPIEKYFKINGNEKVVERFLSFVPNYKDSVLGVYDVEVVWSQIEDRLGEHVCPFASLFAGDFLCFYDEGNKEPKIVIWDHEQSEEDSPTLIDVARNFDEFVKILHS